MNVCHLINRLSSGGAQELVFNIIRKSSQDDIEYQIACLEPSLDYNFDQDIPITNFQEQFKFDPRAIHRARAFFQSNQIDILHTHMPYATVIGRTLGNKKGRKIISTHHSVPSNYHIVTRNLERITRSRDSATVTVSSSVEKKYTGSSNVYTGGRPDRWCTIRNGIDIKAFNQSVKAAEKDWFVEKYGNLGKPIYINIGRYRPVKSQITIIDSMVDVVEKNPEAQLLLIGRGPMEEELKRETKKRGLEENITVTGYIPKELIHTCYAVADCFILSSIDEGLPTVLIEAMAAELPIITTNISSASELVEDGVSGLIIEQKNTEQMVEAILALQKESKRRQYGNEGYERAKKMFDISQTVKSYESLYKHIYQI